MDLLSAIGGGLTAAYLDSREKYNDPFRPAAQEERKYVHLKKEYSESDLLWKWSNSQAESKLTEIFSMDKILRYRRISLICSSSRERPSSSIYCLYDFPNPFSSKITLDFMIDEMIKTPDVLSRIDWLLRHFKCLPNIWYDGNGDPYIIAGNAAIQKIDIW